MPSLNRIAVDTTIIAVGAYNLAELFNLIDGPEWAGAASLGIILFVLLLAGRIDLDGKS